MKKVRKVMELALVPLLLILAIGIPVVNGCKQTPYTIALKADAGLITTVDGAMNGWRDYVLQGSNQVTQAQLDAVKDAYGKYYSSQIIASNAFVNFYAVSKSTDTNAVARAKLALDAAAQSVASSQASIISLVNSFIGGKTK